MRVRHRGVLLSLPVIVAGLAALCLALPAPLVIAVVAQVVLVLVLVAGAAKSTGRFRSVHRFYAGPEHAPFGRRAARVGALALAPALLLAVVTPDTAPRPAAVPQADAPETTPSPAPTSSSPSPKVTPRPSAARAQVKHPKKKQKRKKQRHHKKRRHHR